MPEVGDVLAGKYRLEALLGSGGMADVYRALNEAVGRRVALKVLRSEHTTNAPIVERFLREARAANLVRHPNVVDMLDIARAEDGSPFIVQELLEGQDLLHYVQERGGKLTTSEIAEYVVPVIEAVAEAHEHGVVHRDLKPENVFLATKGKERIPKLLDFGISKIRHPSIRATELAVMVGTPAYMAPEQVRGTTDADTRTDVWSIGIMLFELLSGDYPFASADSPALFVDIATKDAPSLASVAPEVPADLCAIVDRCLRRDPDERYANAGLLAADARRVLRLGAPAPLGRSDPPLAIPNVTPPKVPSLAPPTVRTKVAGSMATPLQPAAPVKPPPLALADTPPRARPPHVAGWELVRERAPEPDYAPIIGLAVVGMTAIGATAVLSTFARRPEGLPVLTWVTTATPSMTTIVHAALALVCLIAAFSTLWAGVKRWRGEVEGGRTSAIVRGAISGAILFVAIELARAAF